MVRYEKARAHFDQLLVNHQTAAHLMESLSATDWVLWSPQSPDNVALIIQGFRTYIQQTEAPRSLNLHLIALFEPMVGIEEAALLQDL